MEQPRADAYPALAVPPLTRQGPAASPSPVGLYRAVLGIIAIAVPAMGLVDWEPGADSMAMRLLIGAACATLAAASYRSPWVRDHLRQLLVVVGQGVLAWFLWLAYLHGLTHEDVIGLMPCAAIAPMLVATPAELVAVLASTVVGSAAVSFTVVAPEAPPVAATALLSLLTLGLGLASLGRSRSEAKLAILNQELESRVTARTAELRASLDRVEEIARQRAEAEAEAREASQAKSQFLANMSHELRTPLNAIMGYTQMVREELPAEQSDADADLARVEKAGAHLLSLIDDVLDLSRVEAGQLELQLEPVPLADLVGELWPMVAPEAAQGVQLTTEIPQGLRAHADRDRLQQVLLNLLSNALKFTPHDSVTVGATQDADQVHLFVRDTGIGIAAQILPHVFDRFHQADTSFTRRHQGTGLGLALSQQLVQQMGGQLVAVSTEGEGSTFTVILPAA